MVVIENEESEVRDRSRSAEAEPTHEFSLLTSYSSSVLSSCMDVVTSLIFSFFILETDSASAFKSCAMPLLYITISTIKERSNPPSNC